MNPFDLRGPQFLAFYLFASAVGLIIMYLASRGALFGTARAPAGDARRQLRDPYLLAYLRGGVGAALQTVAFSLSKRRLLTATSANVIASRSTEALAAVKNPLEHALLSQCSTSQPFSEVLRDRRLQIAAENYAEPLRVSGLIADDGELARRRPAFQLVAGTLFTLGAIKIYLALQRGHSNVLFLVILTLLVVVLVHRIYRRQRTNGGDRALGDQQTLFARLKGRAARMSVDGASDEAVLVVAAFGLAALPAASYPFIAQLRRQMTDSSSSSWSSCSSSSSCGGGGGCGGCGS